MGNNYQLSLWAITIMIVIALHNLRGSRWGLMLSVNGPYSIVFNVEMLKISLSTVIEDLAVKCC